MIVFALKYVHIIFTNFIKSIFHIIFMNLVSHSKLVEVGMEENVDVMSTTQTIVDPNVSLKRAA